MKRKKTFCKAKSVIKSYIKIVASLLHGGKRAVDKVEQIALSNKTLDVLWSLSYQPYIHKRVNGNAAIDGRGERNQKWLRSSSLDHGTINRCNYCKAPIAKLQSSSTVQITFAWYFVENIFLNGVRKVARRPWAPRTVLEFAIKTRYVLDSWTTSCCPSIFSRVLENS